MTSWHDSLRIAFAEYLQGYHASLLPDTDAVAEFADRAYSKSVVIAAGRMVDDADAMLKSWRKNNTSESAHATPYLPIVIIAVDKNWSPAPPDWAPRQQSDATQVLIPDDPLGRLLNLTVTHQERRAQVVIFAQETQTCNSLAAQLHRWCSQVRNRTFYATYELAGVPQRWPVQLETPDLVAIDVKQPEGVKNISVLACDFTLRAAVPVVTGPKSSQPNDGQGEGTYADPHGAPFTVEADIESVSSNRTYNVQP